MGEDSTKCCFCMPVRTGIIIWACITLAYHLSFLILVATWIIFLLGFGDGRLSGWSADEVISPLLTLIEVVYNVTLLVIVINRAKNTTMLKAVFLFGTSVWIITTAYFCCIVYRVVFTAIQMKHSHDADMVKFEIGLVAAILQMLLDGYVLLLIRSEILKLKNHYERVEFVNFETGAHRDNSIFGCPDSELVVRNGVSAGQKI